MRSPVTDSGAETIRVNLLEGFQVEGTQGSIDLPYSSQRVLAFLAFQTRRSARTWVAGTLWVDCNEARAGANLRSALWRINRCGHHLVDADTRAVGLAPEVEVDLRDTSARAHDVIRANRIPGDADLDDLIDLGEVLPGWYDDWVITERERFHQLRLHALETLCDQLALAGRFSLAIEAGLAAVSGEPLRESAHRALIRAHLLEGNRGEAIRQYEQCRTVLRRELGVDPSPATGRLLGT
jgi:DNA-binding SARP family transcriptional activator